MKAGILPEDDDCFECDWDELRRTTDQFISKVNSIQMSPTDMPMLPCPIAPAGDHIPTPTMWRTPPKSTPNHGYNQVEPIRDQSAPIPDRFDVDPEFIAPPPGIKIEPNISNDSCNNTCCEPDVFMVMHLLVVCAMMKMGSEFRALDHPAEN